MEKLILAINPGSTTTKLAVYKGFQLIKVETIKYDMTIINQFPSVYEQKAYRLDFVYNFLKANDLDIKDIDFFVGRGGLLKPLKHSGTFLVNEKMVSDLASAKYGSHASNLGAIMAYELAQSMEKVAYTVDPVIVDELDDVARVSGLKGIDKKSIFHALNQKSVAKKYAHDINKKYDELNLIVAHLGSGISIGWHKYGRVVDVNNALGGEGPFTPERSGTLPAFSLLELCYSGKYNISEVKKMLVSNGGLMSYLNTSDGLEIKRRIENGNQEASFYLEAMAYQIVKEIGQLYMVSKGKAKTLILTGGLAHFNILIDIISNYVNNILEVVVYPGENEMESLVHGVIRVLDKSETIQIYE